MKQSQADKFKAAAREAECDMDEKAFDKALGKLAKSEKPAPKAVDESVEEPPEAE